MVGNGDLPGLPTGPGFEGVLADLIACPSCDLVYSIPDVASHERAVCARCHTILISPRRKAGKQLIALVGDLNLVWEGTGGGKHGDLPTDAIDQLVSIT